MITRRAGTRQTCTVTRASDGSTTIYVGQPYNIAGTGFKPGLSVKVQTIYLAFNWIDGTWSITTDTYGGFSITNNSGYNGSYSASVYSGSTGALLTSCSYTLKALGT